MKVKQSNFEHLLQTINAKLKKEIDSYDDIHIELISTKIISKFATNILLRKQFNQDKDTYNLEDKLSQICKLNPSEEISSLINEYFSQYDYAKLNAREFASKYIADIKTDDTNITDDTKNRFLNHIKASKNLKNILILDFCARDGDIIIFVFNELLKRGLESKDIVSNNIFAVEKSQKKQFIIKLRIWFALITQNENNLPSLENNIFLGDSLIQTLNGTNIIDKEHLFFSKSDELIDKLKFEINDISKVQQNIKQILQSKYDENNIELKSKIRNLQTFKSDIKNIKKDMQRNLYNIELIKDMINTKHIFILDIVFANIIQNGGFDIIISHLPSIKISNNKLLKMTLKNEDYKCFSNHAYLRSFFEEKAQSLSKEKIFI